MRLGPAAAGCQFALCLLCAFGYAWDRDWKYVAYWLLAAGLTAVVTWWM
jgi:hypothetical protein